VHAVRTPRPTRTEYATELVLQSVLRSSTEEIHSAVGLITQIADQTRLLAPPSRPGPSSG